MDQWAGQLLTFCAQVAAESAAISFCEALFGKKKRKLDLCRIIVQVLVWSFPSMQRTMGWAVSFLASENHDYFYTNTMDGKGQNRDLR